jgi:hypothetical protein
MAARGALTPALLDRLADTLAAMHAALPPLPDVDAPAAMRRVLEGNLRAAEHAGVPGAGAWASQARAWLEPLSPALAARAVRILADPGARGAAPGIGVWNPGFDVTPAALISGIITERGVLRRAAGASVFDVRAFLGLAPSRCVALDCDAALAYAALAARHGLAPAELALRFAMSHPACVCALTGATDAEQLAQLLRAAEAGPLPQELLDEIDGVHEQHPSPTP